MDVFDLAGDIGFWVAWLLAALVLGVLRLLAAEEARRQFYTSPRGFRFARPPGIWAIAVGDMTVMSIGVPRARFFNPSAFVEFCCYEPTLLGWYVAAWAGLLGAWAWVLYVTAVLLAWRLLLDCLIRRGPLTRTMVHCAWAAASGVFFAAASVIVLVVMMILLTVIVAAMGGGERRKRRYR